MKEKNGNESLSSDHAGKETAREFKGYPLYPDEEDIYKKYQEEKEVDPENISKNKNSDDLFGNDLDIPGSELDDEQESIGSEDEENNYYSLGGDGHNDLDED
ncbi:MAG: hypothetical protein EHM93_17605 [Bacteroidales bacterium]|nr:MAG: hypothetical protein EHM93_17605 [Bacteroidales bacterium]